jgi:protein tyrosine/serine phosphatase
MYSAPHCIRLLRVGERIAIAITVIRTIPCWVLLLAVLGFGQTQPARMVRIDEHIYRGHQPGREDYDKLAQAGIRTILDLRGGSIHKPHEEKMAKAAGLDYISIRLSGFWEPHDWQMARVLSVMEDPARWPIFLHCRRGDDRVGMVIACYRIAHDHWTNAEALAEARHNGLFPLELLMRRYVLHFQADRAMQAQSR